MHTENFKVQPGIYRFRPDYVDLLCFGLCAKIPESDEVFTVDCFKQGNLTLKSKSTSTSVDVKDQKSYVIFKRGSNGDNIVDFELMLNDIKEMDLYPNFSKIWESLFLGYASIRPNNMGPLSGMLRTLVANNAIAFQGALIERNGKFFPSNTDFAKSALNALTNELKDSDERFKPLLRAYVQDM